MTSRRVLIAPDSFKGSIGAIAAARAIARGWLSVRSHDQLDIRPMADGGEGTAAVIANAIPEARWQGRTEPRTATDGPGPSRWLQLPDGTAIIELAASCGLELLGTAQPMTASTFALGQTIKNALDEPTSRIIITLGGSASTDGGTGALRALGARFLDEAGRKLPDGGGSLRHLHTIDISALDEPPSGGVEVLTDVRTVLLGPTGAARTFAPQKGATAQQVQVLEEGLERLDELVHASVALAHQPDSTLAASAHQPGSTLAASAHQPDSTLAASAHQPGSTLATSARQPGSGAAGGTGFGLSALWQATLSPGAPRIADLTGIPADLGQYDVVISGEGRLDDTTADGKVVHEVMARANTAAQRIVICGTDTRERSHDKSAFRVIELVQLACNTNDAIENPAHWLHTAAARAAGAIATEP